MQAVKTIALDIAKSVFQVHGVDADGQAVIRRNLKRRYVWRSFRRSNDMSSFPCGTGGLLGPVFCGAYVMGYLHAVQALKPPGICRPAFVSGEHAMEVLKRWTIAHPDVQSIEALAKRPADAFRAEWPCK
jgi:hypothetical protein